MKKVSLLKGWIILSTTYYLLSAVYGCGYTTHSAIAEKYHTVYVENFVNTIDITNEADALKKYRINRPLLEVDITRAVNNKFLFDGNFKSAKSDTADLTLRGQLIEFRQDPLRYTNNDEVAEYRVNVVVNMTLWDNRENKALWQENSFTGDTTYFTQGPSAKSETAAINDAIDDIARRIVERAVEQW